jgi:hypothetical protein
MMRLARGPATEGKPAPDWTCIQRAAPSKSGSRVSRDEGSNPSLSARSVRGKPPGDQPQVPAFFGAALATFAALGLAGSGAFSHAGTAAATGADAGAAGGTGRSCR